MKSLIRVNAALLLLAGMFALSHPASAAAQVGSTAVVLDTYAGQVSLINTSTRHVYTPITVGNFPVAVAISG